MICIELAPHKQKDIQLKPAATFYDAAYWDQVAAKHLPHYDLPSWNEPATAESFAGWLERMSLPVRAFLRMGNYRDLQDAIDLNPSWPLRAFIGLALERLEFEENGGVF